MPQMIGALAGIIEHVRIGHGITALLSGLIPEAHTTRLCLKSSNSSLFMLPNPFSYQN